MEPPGGRGDSRFNLAYSMNLLSGETAADIYGTNPLGRGPQNSTSLPQMTNTRHSMISTVCGSQRNTSSGMKSNTPESCYDEHRGMTSAQSLGLDSCGVPEIDQDQYTSMQPKKSPPSNGKKTKGRVKIKMEYIENKLRRYTTFSKRKTGIMKKAYELSTLTGTQVMLLVASETGHVYTFATRKLQPMITSEAGKALIQTCLNSPDPPGGGSSMGGSGGDQRMSATGFEETELTYNISDDDLKEEAMSPMGDSSESSGAESSGMQPEYESTNLLDFKGILANNNTTISSITTAPSEIKISSPSTVSTTNSTTPSSAQTSLTSTVTPQSNGTISNLNSASGNTSSPIAGTLPPGLTVYQTPQGAVYATTTSTAGVKGASAGVLLSLQSAGPNSQPHFITIPLQVGAAAVAAAAAAVSGSQPPPLVTTVQQKDQKELDLSAKSATTTMSGRK